jgi:hypothetical protein
MPSLLRRKRRSAITCKYLSYQLPNGGHIRLPLLHIRLSHEDQSLTTIALIDSGSTTTFVPLELAEILSLPIEKEASAVGAGGSFNNTIRKVNISLLKGRTTFAKFGGFSAYVPLEEGRVPYVVLGRDSVFRKFDITFRENQQRFILRGSKT